MLRLRLSQGISSGCQHATLTLFFWICHQCGKVALCFFFDLERVYFRMPPCHPKQIFFNFSKLSLVWQRGLMLLLRLIKGISSGCHNAIPTPQIFFAIVSVGQGALCFCFDLARVFIQGKLWHQYTKKIFGSIIIVGRALRFGFDLAKVFLQCAKHANPALFF